MVKRYLFTQATKASRFLPFTRGPEGRCVQQAQLSVRSTSGFAFMLWETGWCHFS